MRVTILNDICDESTPGNSSAAMSQQQADSYIAVATIKVAITKAVIATDSMQVFYGKLWFRSLTPRFYLSSENETPLVIQLARN